MDPTRFDALARALSAQPTRRGVLRLLAGAALGGALGARHRGGAAAACPSGKRSYGSSCTRNTQCQTGFCFKPANGNNRCLCRDVYRQPCGGPCSNCPQGNLCGNGCPENCAAGVTNSCGPDGSCACVKNADGGSACVERICSFDGCTTGTDCGSGLCVDVPGCCGEPNPFCGVRCGSGGPNAARTTGWR